MQFNAFRSFCQLTPTFSNEKKTFIHQLHESRAQSDAKRIAIKPGVRCQSVYLQDGPMAPSLKGSYMFLYVPTKGSSSL